MTGITVYYKEDFGGKHVELPVGTYTQAQLKAQGIDNNTISSVQVPPGFKAILYKHDNFTGDKMELLADAKELGPMHNNASSIEVKSHDSRRVEFFYKEQFNGKKVSLPVGEYTQAELERYGIDNNTISSVKVSVAGGLKAVLYKHDNFSGDQLPVNADAPTLGAMHNNASSIKVA